MLSFLRFVYGLGGRHLPFLAFENPSVPLPVSGVHSEQSFLQSSYFVDLGFTLGVNVDKIFRPYFFSQSVTRHLSSPVCRESRLDSIVQTSRPEWFRECVRARV